MKLSNFSKNLSVKDWKEILKKYEIRKTGEIISCRFNKPLKPNITKCGYEIVCLYFNSKSKWFSVHRLVAFVHVKNNSTKFNVVNHIDGDKRNNDSINLEWTTSSLNKKHSFEIGTSTPTKSENVHRAILTIKDVKEIKRRLSNGEKGAKIARDFNVTSSNICAIKNGRSWRNV